MEGNSAEDHIAQFKILVNKSKLDTTSAMLIDAFRETLKIPLQWQILNLEKAPTTLKEWYEAAIKLDNKYRRIQRIIGRSNPDKGKNDKGKKKEDEPRRRWNLQKKDPNAMDINVLSVEQWEEHMRKGLCFKCHKPGHRSNDCKEGTPTTTNTAPKTPPAYSPKIATFSKKMTPREIYTHIRSLLRLWTFGPNFTSFLWYLQTSFVWLSHPQWHNHHWLTQLLLISLSDSLIHDSILILTHSDSLALPLLWLTF